MKQRFFEAFNDVKTNQTTEIVSSIVSEKVRIRTRYEEDDIFVDTSGELWEHERYCSIDWRKCKLAPQVRDALRQFIWHRLASNSPSTANGNFRQIIDIQEEIGKYQFPWTVDACTQILGGLQHKRDTFLSFRLFYRWCALKEINGFTAALSAYLDDFSMPDFDVYKSIKFRDKVFTVAEEEKYVQALDVCEGDSDYFSYRDNVIAHLNWELGLRPEQVAGIENKHFVVTNGPNGENFYKLQIIRLKQKTYSTTYRSRVISNRLAEKIKILIQLRREYFGAAPSAHPLFETALQKRINSAIVRYAIAGICEDAQICPATSTFLRHNMAQKLADQGTPSDLISDMLDHTTKIAARHYVAATPAIAKIKARALGKNSTYKELMTLMTASPIDPKNVEDKRSVIKGVVATRYIGHIGKCGLDADTACEKNPIYSCYTCRKFHPFIDGHHEDVISALRGEVQVMVDQSLDLAENKVVLQLEKTIEHVCDVNDRCHLLALSKQEKSS